MGARTGTKDYGAAVKSFQRIENFSRTRFLNQRLSSGLILLVPPMRILYMNQRASELTRLVNDNHVKSPHGDPQRAKGLLPEKFLRTCAELPKQGARVVGDSTITIIHKTYTRLSTRLST